MSDQDATPDSPQMVPPKWKRFEEFVAAIQTRMVHDARVTCDDRIVGKSGVERQIDISIRYRIAQFKMLAVIDCKDWSRPVDIADVGSFADMVEDVRANKGAIVCNAGFTEGARKRAIEKGIDLLMAVDASSVEWPSRLGIPTLCRCTCIGKSATFEFHYAGSDPFAMPNGDPQYFEVYREDKSFNDILVNLLRKAWNDRKLPADVGEHKKEHFFQNEAYIKAGDSYYGPFEITVSFTVEERLLFGYVPLKKGQGFMNATTRAFTTKEVEFGVDFDEVEKKWRRLEREDDLAVQPVLILPVLDCYPLIEYAPTKPKAAP